MIPEDELNLPRGKEDNWWSIICFNSLSLENYMVILTEMSVMNEIYLACRGVTLRQFYGFNFRKMRHKLWEIPMRRVNSYTWWMTIGICNVHFPIIFCLWFLEIGSIFLVSMSPFILNVLGYKRKLSSLSE